MIRRVASLSVLAAFSFLPANAGSDLGKVLDRQSLARMESYCVETANLADDEALVVKGFLKEQGKPKGLLKDLKWKRLEGCKDYAADATIKLEFPRFVNPNLGPSRGELDRLKGILRVYDNSTSGIIYTAEALPLNNADNPSPFGEPEMYGGNLYQRRLDSLRRVFSMLIHDLKSLPAQPKK